MSAPDLWALFCALPTSSQAESGQLPAVAVPGRSGDFLAKTSGGEAAFLLRGAQRQGVKPPLRLRHVEVDYGSRCRILENAATSIEGNFIVIRCTDVDRSMLELFVRAVQALIAALPSRPAPANTESLIARVVELFRRLAQPSRRSVKGLWAELFIIDRCGPPDQWVSAWHAEADEKYDFITSRGYLEVKATEQASRVHEFSVGQLRGSNSPNGLVASLLLRRAAGGCGVVDLARRIAANLKSYELQAKLWANVFEVLGEDTSEASDLAFDERHAEANALTYTALDVPCVPTPLPDGVLDARVVVALDRIPKASCRGLSALAQLHE